MRQTPLAPVARARQAIGFLLACYLALGAAGAHADWLEATGDHFVIYADQGERDVRLFAERLERYHAAMAFRFQAQQAKPSPSNRVTVFVVSNKTGVQKLAESDNRYLAGFYVPRAGATVAVVPKLDRASSGYALSAETILYHEYAHHFMAGLTARAFPRWFTEGFAEFFSSVTFERDGGVGLGAPANYRAPELVFGRAVPIRRLLEFDGGAGGPKSGKDAFYGQSWVLFHYLMFAPERSGQLAQYQSLLGSGKPALEAATGAFGDLDKLEKDLWRYQMQDRLNYLVIEGRALQVGAIAVRHLPPGEAEMMPTNIRSRVGVDAEEALKLLPEARRIAGRHPGEPAVLAALAEAEFDAGNDDEALAAADKALAIDPNRIDAHIQKGYALYRKAGSGAAPAVTWQEVRNQFVRANKIENDNPIPLVQYYRTYLEQGERPTRNAVEGLEWAMVLAPFDPSLRWMVAQQMIAENRLADAAETLAPLAYSPHPGEDTAQALQLLKDVEARIEAGPANPTE